MVARAKMSDAQIALLEQIQLSQPDEHEAVHTCLNEAKRLRRVLSFIENCWGADAGELRAIARRTLRGEEVSDYFRQPPKGGEAKS